MTVTLYDTETKELKIITATMYIFNNAINCHEILVKFGDDDFLYFDDKRYRLSYISA